MSRNYPQLGGLDICVHHAGFLSVTLLDIGFRVFPFPIGWLPTCFHIAAFRNPSIVSAASAAPRDTHLASCVSHHRCRGCLLVPTLLNAMLRDNLTWNQLECVKNA